MPSKSDIPYLLLAIVMLFIGFFFILLIYAIFWNVDCFCPESNCSCEPKLLIENAKLIARQGLLILTVRNIGSATTSIMRLELVSVEQSGSSQGGSSGSLCTPISSGQHGQVVQNPELPPGASLTIQYNCGQGLKAGTTYYVIVYYTKGNTEVPTDPYPVTAR